MKSVAIIGGGCMGLGIARELAADFHVTVHERNERFGEEASGASAGMIGPQSEAMEDDAYFSATLASRDLWPGYAKSLQVETGIDLGFKTEGALHLAFGAAYEKRLEAKYLWQKKKAGKLDYLDGPALRQRYPYLHPRVSSAWEAWGDYWVDNEAMMQALEASARQRGVEMKAGSRIDPGRLPEADIVVLAAGAWAGRLFPQIAPVHPVKGQMLSFKVPPQLMPDKPIHAEFVYLVPRGDALRPEGCRLLVGATVETVAFNKAITGEGIEYLLQNAFETIPDLRSCEVDKLWAGLRPGASDGWPTLGKSPLENLHLAVGHYRRGILFLPLTAQALAQEIRGGGLPEAAKPFSFERHASLHA